MYSVTHVWNQAFTRPKVSGSRVELSELYFVQNCVTDFGVQSRYSCVGEILTTRNFIATVEGFQHFLEPWLFNTVYWHHVFCQTICDGVGELLPLLAATCVLLLTCNCLDDRVLLRRAGPGLCAACSPSRFHIGQLSRMQLQVGE